MGRVPGKEECRMQNEADSEAIRACGINNGRNAHRNALCISNLSGSWRSALLRRLYDRNTCITSSSGMARQITSALRPQLPVQRAVLDGFGNMIGGDLFGAGQVGDRAGHF